MRLKVLKEFNKIDAEIHYVVVDKEKVFYYLREKKPKLYNYIAGLILQELSIDFEEVHIIVDKREPKLVTRQDFDQYIRNKLSGVRTKISHFSSANDSALQTVDYICWSIFRKYEYSDSSYYDLLKNKITTSKKFLLEE